MMKRLPIIFLASLLFSAPVFGACVLKQSTAVILSMGPYVDKDDGVTEETGLGDMDVEVAKNGGAFAAQNDTTANAHDAEGWYTINLDATDTNTLGLLVIKTHAAATHLPVWLNCEVVTANVWDSRYSTDTLQVDVVELAGNGPAADGLERSSSALTLGQINEGTPTATSWAADGFTEATNNHFSGATVYGVTGVNTGMSRVITSYTGSSQTFDFTNDPWLEASADDDFFIIMPGRYLINDDINTEADTALTDYGALKPTTGGRTLDVNATGEAGADIVRISDDTTAADNAELFFDGTGYTGGSTKLDVNTVQISFDTGAANNLESDYDGTGYTKAASVINQVTSLGTTAKSDVNAEMVDVVNVDTLVEPSAGVPPVTPTLNQSLAYLYLKDIRDKTTTTATTYTIFNDAGVALWSYALSDDGTTFTRAEAL